MESRLQCHICKKTFTQKSSLIRHSKRCTPGPAPSLRQKSCKSCTTSKTKCDLQRPRCGRCEQRDTPCEYVVPMTRGTRVSSPTSDGSTASPNEDVYESSSLVPTTIDAISINLPEASQDTPSANILNDPLGAFSFANTPEPGLNSIFNFTSSLDKDPFGLLQWPFDPNSQSLPSPPQDSIMRLTLPPEQTSSTTTPESRDYGNDWLLWNPGSPNTTPPLVKHSMETLLRVMKTWPKMLAKGLQTPPMFHFSHVDQATILRPMENCIRLARMWASQSNSAIEVVRQTIVQEMRTLFEQYQSMDERHLLSALQALVMYSTILMFPGRGQVSVSLVDPAIFLCLQRVVSYVARTGLMLTEERDNERPSWESWVHVTAKRRAVFSLYLLHWSYSVYHGIESFACSQLGFMPAPAPKFLWQAETRDKWEELYNLWLGQWDDCPYMMREFADIRAGTALEPRTEQWLEDADELGVLFFSIVNATEREPAYEIDRGIPVLTS